VTQREFRLAAGHLFRSGVARVAALVGIAGSSTFLGLYAVGKIGGDVLADALLGFGLGPIPFLLQQWQEGRGAVILGPDGIRIRSMPMTLNLAWRHMTSVQVKLSGADNLLGKWLAAGHRRYVEVKLSRRPRLRIWGPGRGGTDIFGWPLGPKTFRLHVQDPEGFLRAVEPFLRDPSVSGTRPSA
jgi:hypothetical protein